MLIVAVLFGISTNYDKLVVQHSDPFFGSSMIYLFLGGCFFVISLYSNRFNLNVYRKNFPKFYLIGLAYALMGVAINTALTMQIVPYVISLKRMSILFSVFYGGLIFKEKDILKRSLGALVIIVGVILIILF
jgi:uncharacterized membrane protein